MMFRKKKCIVQHYHQLRVATNSFHIVLYCCTSFIISSMRKTCCFLDAPSKTFQTETLPSREKKSNWPGQLPNRILAVGFSRFSGNGDHCLSVLAKVWKRRSWLGCYCTLDWKYTQKYLGFFWKLPSTQVSRPVQVSVSRYFFNRVS